MASRPVYYAVFIALLAFLHFTLHLAFGFGPQAPDLITVAALLAARRLRGGQAAALGFALGILADALARTSFGASALALTVVSYIGSRSRDLFEGESLLYILVYLLFGKWLHDAIIWLLPGGAGGDAVRGLLIASPVFALYAAVAGVTALVLYRAASGERV
jgi:rod shape-determining protein MreD